MIRLSSFLATLLLCVVLAASIFAAVSFKDRHSDAAVLDRRLTELHQQARQGSDATVARAIDQTMACLADRLHRQQGRYGWVDHGDTWDQQRLVMWDPCEQQGAWRLHLNGQDLAIPGFLQRLAPVTARLAQASRDGVF